MRLTGAHILIKTLIEQEVDTIFGYPGGSILDIYDALSEYKSEIKNILTSTEQGAAHAADGYRCSNTDDLKTSLEKALKSEKSSIIECIIGRNEQVLPMIPSACTLSNVILK